MTNPDPNIDLAIKIENIVKFAQETMRGRCELRILRARDKNPQGPLWELLNDLAAKIRQIGIVQ